jgi:hypothetical protein
MGATTGMIHYDVATSSVACLRSDMTGSVNLCIQLVGRHVMTSSEKELETVIPDLRDIPLDRLTDLGDSALGQSIALYRKRLKENAMPLSSFTARI